MTSVGIIGASGYTGAELLRLCAQHPRFEVKLATGDSQAGTPISDLYPSLAGAYGDAAFDTYAGADQADGLDLVFLALPHGASQEVAPDLLGRVGAVVDLAADFRLTDPELYPTWYGRAHTRPDLLGKFAFGLPELFRSEIAAADAVAAPGCYVTAATLALAPLLRAGLVEPTGIVVDAASGVSGAGRGPKPTSSFCTVDEDFTAYGLLTHRHTPEIEQALTAAMATTGTPATARGAIAGMAGVPGAAGRASTAAAAAGTDMTGSASGAIAGTPGVPGAAGRASTAAAAAGTDVTGTAATASGAIAGMAGVTGAAGRASTAAAAGGTDMTGPASGAIAGMAGVTGATGEASTAAAAGGTGTIGTAAPASGATAGMGVTAHMASMAAAVGGAGTSGRRVQVLFTPHLAPMNRGILATCYARPTGSVTTGELLELLNEAWRDEPFVVAGERSPSTKATLGSNTAHVTARADERTGWVVALAALDNLVKGASGQAVQCANLVTGLPETTGLPVIGLYP